MAMAKAEIRTQMRKGNLEIVNTITVPVERITWDIIRGNADEALQALMQMAEKHAKKVAGKINATPEDVYIAYADNGKAYSYFTCVTL